ncbi:MAG: hypothetical protein R3250_05560 [Melioribacteraceae bacterium]|nr:hypothetical protein [Melioribacteraceae bacterium]
MNLTKGIKNDFMNDGYDEIKKHRYQENSLEQTKLSDAFLKN